MFLLFRLIRWAGQALTYFYFSSHSVISACLCFVFDLILFALCLFLTSNICLCSEYFKYWFLYYWVCLNVCAIGLVHTCNRSIPSWSKVIKWT